MSVRIIKASSEEKSEYLKQKPVYPLYGWVTVDGHRCAIEDLRCWPKEDPQYEVMAPTGHHFTELPGEDCNSALHSLLCHDHSDIRDRVDFRKIEKCTE
jgi:hypothetical protein